MQSVETSIVGPLAEEISDEKHKDRIAEVLALSEAGYKNCNPNKHSYMGLVSYGMKGFPDVRGKWQPGRGHPYWGPGGSKKKKLYGRNKWCALIQVYNWKNRLLSTSKFKKNMVVFGTASPAVHVYVVMNDDRFGDNKLHPTDPMRYKMAVTP